MRQRVLQSGEAPHLVIDNVAGSLTIRGWERPEVQISYGDEDDLKLNQTEEAIAISCESDCAIQAPHAATLAVRQVEGDSQVNGIQGQIKIETVESNLQLRNVGPVTLENVEGDLNVRDLHGDLWALQVAGNAHISDLHGNLHCEQMGGDTHISDAHGALNLVRVEGNLRLRSVGVATIGEVEGDFALRDGRGDISVQTVSGTASISRLQGRFVAETIEGDLNLTGGEHDLSAQVSGNAALQLNLLPGKTVQITAEGDIACQLAPEVSAQVHLKSEGDMTISGLNTPPRGGGGEIEFTLGAGEATLVLSSEGNIALSSQRLGWEPGRDFGNDFNFGAEFGPEFGLRAADFAQRLASQIEHQVENATRHLDRKLAHIGNGEEIAARVQEKVQKAMRQAEEKLAETMRHAERRAQEAERRAVEMEARHQRHAPGWHMRTPAAPMPPRPPKAPGAPQAKGTPAGAEERMMILRMVSEGKLSVEQADQLLAAMGG